MQEKTGAFNYRNIQELKHELERLKLSLPLAEKTDAELFRQPLKINEKVVPNRLCIHPMEGCDGEANGAPGPLTLRRYKRFAAGGAGLIWVEACAVVPEGKANPRQISINEASFAKFKELADCTREHALDFNGKKQNPFLVLQLTHSGRYSKPFGGPKPVIFQRSAYLDKASKLPADYPLITDKELDALQEKYVQAAELAERAGFDAVDIKACHGYLMYEILGAHTRTDSKYGGAYENRVRLFLEILTKIRARLPKMIITSRLGICDFTPYPYGFGMSTDGSMNPDLTEPLKFIDTLGKKGINLLNICVANPYYNPHVERPYDFPVSGMKLPEGHPLTFISKNMELTAEVARKNPGIHMISTGFTWLRQFAANSGYAMLKKGACSIVGLGRLALANPGFANEILSKGELTSKKACITCSSCTQMMRDGTTAGCAIYDSGVYGSIYYQGRLKDPAYLKGFADNCRSCALAPCASNCPAGMDIPGFILACAKGDIAGGYRIMSERNLLPEACSYACPKEELCEKNCSSRILEHKEIPIGEIQKYLSAEARKQGLTKITAGKKNGKKVAVIGFGPAGIACAVRLIKEGFKVSVYEAGEKPGGIASSVIPKKRLPQNTLENEVAAFKLEETGLFELSYGKALGAKLTVDDLLKAGFDSVFISAGLSEDTGLESGIKPKGVYSALEFLKNSWNFGISMPSRAVVLGGGNSAMDSALALKELGVEDVFLAYRRSYKELPAWQGETKHALAEGVNFLFLTQPLGYAADKNGNLEGIRFARTELGAKDASGRRKPVEVPGSEYLFKAGICVEAFGQKLSAKLLEGLSGVSVKGNRIVLAGGSCRTSKERVYAGGDIVNGGKTVVQAIREGMDAAEEIIKAGTV